MPTHKETRKLPYTANQMYELVADVANYPEFLPWCAASRIKSVISDGPRDTMTADLIISFKVFREQFTSKVVLDSDDLLVDTEYLDGPFKFMKSTWQFLDVEGGCTVEFFVDFELKNAILQRVIGLVFNEAMQRIVRAFEARAGVLYS